jgi:hypothetical protein
MRGLKRVQHPEDSSHAFARIFTAVPLPDYPFQDAEEKTHLICMLPCAAAWSGQVFYGNLYAPPDTFRWQDGIIQVLRFLTAVGGSLLPTGMISRACPGRGMNMGLCARLCKMQTLYFLAPSGRGVCCERWQFCKDSNNCRS